MQRQGNGLSINKERTIIHYISFQNEIWKKNILNQKVLNECVHEFTIQMSTSHYLNLVSSYVNYWKQSEEMPLSL